MLLIQDQSSTQGSTSLALQSEDDEGLCHCGHAPLMAPVRDRGPPPGCRGTWRPECHAASVKEKSQAHEEHGPPTRGQGGPQPTPTTDDAPCAMPDRRETMPRLAMPGQTMRRTAPPSSTRRADPINQQHGHASIQIQMAAPSCPPSPPAAGAIVSLTAAINLDLATSVDPRSYISTAFSGHLAL